MKRIVPTDWILPPSLNSQTSSLLFIESKQYCISNELFGQKCYGVIHWGISEG